MFMIVYGFVLDFCGRYGTIFVCAWFVASFETCSSWRGPFLLHILYMVGSGDGTIDSIFYALVDAV